MFSTGAAKQHPWCRGGALGYRSLDGVSLGCWPRPPHAHLKQQKRKEKKRREKKKKTLSGRKTETRVVHARETNDKTKAANRDCADAQGRARGEGRGTEERRERRHALGLSWSLWYRAARPENTYIESRRRRKLHSVQLRCCRIAVPAEVRQSAPLSTRRSLLPSLGAGVASIPRDAMTLWAKRRWLPR